jgi:hypothetical protein
VDRNRGGRRGMVEQGLQLSFGQVT